MAASDAANDGGPPAFDPVECLERVRRDDQQAAVQLLEYLNPHVTMIVRANLPRRRSDEPDIIQQVFIRIFQRLHQYRGEVPLMHWVARVTHNHCLNVLRSQSSRPEWRVADLSVDEARLVEQVRDPARVVSPGDALVARDLLDRLMAELRPEERLVIELMEIQDRTVKEVAAQTGWSPMAVRTRAFRARQRLNKLYQALKRKDSL